MQQERNVINLIHYLKTFFPWRNSNFSSLLLENRWPQAHRVCIISSNKVHMHPPTRPQTHMYAHTYTQTLNSSTHFQMKSEKWRCDRATTSWAHQRRTCFSGKPSEWLASDGDSLDACVRKRASWSQRQPRWTYSSRRKMVPAVSKWPMGFTIYGQRN